MATLRSLRIRNLVIIEDLAVDFGPGLNLLTGETGAGKSILVDALGLVAGLRADRSLIRTGVDRAVIEAFFEVGSDPEIHAWVTEHGFAELEEGQLLVQREIASAGSGRVLLNGSPCTVGLLRELAGRLLELHGQHEHQSLLVAERQLELLDRFGGHDAALLKVARSAGELQAAATRLEQLRVEAEERTERLERLSETVREIEAVRPRPGEIDELDAERRVLRHASRMAELLDELVSVSFEAEISAASLAAAGAGKAEELAGLDPGLEPLAARMRSAALELQDTGSAFRDYREGSDLDPARLEDVEARRVAIERLCQRYGADEEGLNQRLETARGELSGLAGVDELICAAEDATGKAARAYSRAAAALSVARKKAGVKLARELEAQFAELALAGAKFEVGFVPARGESIGETKDESLPLNAKGAERAEFRLAANPGEPLRPLSQVASGGELARVMLALHVVAEDRRGGRALVFDEVDAGVGGAAAVAVGARLARLAERQQVLCVTHLPQIAAHADQHYRVHKRVASGRTRADIASLSSEKRVDELARMLGGRRPTPASRRHAAELLTAAGRPALPRREV